MESLQVTAAQNTWQDDGIVDNQAREQKGEQFVGKVAICKLGPANHSRVK